MKKCPRCKMTVDTIGVCPVCTRDILAEEECGARGEKYALNKYLLPYLWRCHRFSVMSVGFVLVALFFTITRLTWQFVFPVLLAAVSLVASLFPSWFLKDEYDWFEEMCVVAFLKFLKFFCGGLGIFIAALMALFN